MADDTATLIERLRLLAGQIDPCLIGGKDATLLRDAAARIEALSGEYERGVEEAAKVIRSHKPDASFDDSQAGSIERQALLSNVTDEVLALVGAANPPAREGDV